MDMWVPDRSAEKERFRRFAKAGFDWRTGRQMDDPEWEDMAGDNAVLETGGNTGNRTWYSQTASAAGPVAPVDDSQQTSIAMQHQDWERFASRLTDEQRAEIMSKYAPQQGEALVKNSLHPEYQRTNLINDTGISPEIQRALDSIGYKGPFTEDIGFRRDAQVRTFPDYVIESEEPIHTGTDTVSGTEAPPRFPSERSQV